MESSQPGPQYDIPEGADVEYDEQGNVRLWRNPSQIRDLHPDQVPGYEPKFDRTGPHRRVLAHVTDEVDVSYLGPRNTVPSLAYGLSRDSNTLQISQPSITELRMRSPGVNIDLGGALTAEDQVEQLLGELVEAGLVEQRDDGSYAVTDKGRRELSN